MNIKEATTQENWMYSIQINVPNSSVPEPVDRGVGRSVQKKKSNPSQSAQASLKLEFKSYIDKALQSDDVRKDWIEQMKQALRDGSLDSEQFLLGAAEKIIQNGF